MIFLAHPLLGPLDRQPMVAGEGFHPGLVVGGALSEDLFIHRGDADHVAEEVHHLLGSRQAAQVTVYDDAIEAVVDKGQQVAEQLGEQFHGLPPPRPAKGRKTFKRGPRQRIVEGRSFRLADEVRYIQRRAAEHDSRIVTIAQLVLFSTGICAKRSAGPCSGIQASSTWRRLRCCSVSIKRVSATTVRRCGRSR